MNEISLYTYVHMPRMTCFFWFMRYGIVYVYMHIYIYICSMHTSSYINIFSYTKYIGIGTTYIWYALNDIGFRVVDSVDSWSFGTRELWGVKPASIGIMINTCNLDLNCIICPNESKWNKWIQMVQWSQLILHSFSQVGWDCWDWDPQNQRFWIIAPKGPPPWTTRWSSR